MIGPVDPGTTFSAFADGFPTGLVGTIGVQILNADTGAVVTARTTVGISELAGLNGLYRAALTAPNTQGSYVVVFDANGVHATEELEVGYAAAVSGATGGLLTNLTAVKRSLGREGIVDADGDARITLYIAAYSRAIAAYCDRVFIAEDGVARIYRYDGSGYLNLAPYELRGTPTLLEFDSDQSAPYTVAVTDYRLEPRGGDHLTGTYLWLSLPTLNRGAWPGNLSTPLDREVRVTGDWGPTSVPADVELACVIACTNAYRNPAGFVTARSGGMDFGEEDFGNDAPGAGLSLPQDARAILGPYRRGGGL